MLADVSYDIGHEEISIRDDSDGEPRIIGVEATLELEIPQFLWSPQTARCHAHNKSPEPLYLMYTVFSAPRLTI